MTTHEVAIIVLGHIRSLHSGNKFIPPHFTCPNMSIIQPGQLQKLRQEMAMATWVFEPLVGRMTRHKIHHFEFRWWYFSSTPFWEQFEEQFEEYMHLILIYSHSPSKIQDFIHSPGHLASALGLSIKRAVSKPMAKRLSPVWLKARLVGKGEIFFGQKRWWFLENDIF